jgi:hypothetical protein
MHSSSRKFLVLVVMSLSILILSCAVNDSTNPYSPSNTTIGLSIESPKLQSLTGESFSDTIGDAISIGAIAYLSDNIDSTRITVLSLPADTDTSFLLRFYNSPLSYDTAWARYIPGDTGTKSIKVTAYIRNGIIFSDSAILIVYPKPMPMAIDTIQPAIKLISPVKDSSIITTSSMAIVLSCKDASGIASLVCTTGVYRFSAVQSENPDSVWTTNITGLVPGQYSAITFIATDKSVKANKDTITLHIKYDSDTISPKMRLITPAKDSAVVNASSYMMRIVCKDPSGISSLACSMGGSAISIIHNPGDSIWQANVVGLAAAQYNKIIFIAIDSSMSANKDSFAVYIKYDPNSEDSDGPAFFQVSGPVAGAIVKDSIISITDSIIDPSGVDSVYWTLNGAIAGMLSIDLNNKYSLKDTLKRYHLDTIVIYAQDKSAHRNKSSSTIVLDYNPPPMITDTVVSAQKNTVISWTMHAISADNDPLTWSIVSSPSSASGAITGTLPGIVFTPITNWSGTDSMLVRVFDGKWSDTAKVKITIFDVPVAPKNVKIVLQPASDTIIAGKSMVFSVSMNADVNPAPSYQWYFNGTAITGATASTYPLGSVALKDAGAYSVTATNSLGSATSPAEILVVLMPPSIATQPMAQTKCTGDAASFTIAASGTEPFSFKWKKNNTAIVGSADDATYTIAAISASDSGSYSCLVTNSAGNVSSQSVKLTIKIPPSISTQTTAITKCVGLAATFTVAASGTSPFSYKWKKNGTDISGALDAATYSINAVSESDSGSYSCTVTNGCGGGATSQSARLTVNTPPTIIQHPVSQTKWAGDSVSFTVKATGSGTLSYQWKKGNSNISGATSDTYKISHIFYSADHDAAISCVVTNGCGNGVTSNAAVLTVNAVKAVATGVMFSLILKTDNTLWVCGINSGGQLGDGTTTERHIPVQIMPNVTNISAGGMHSLILKTDGTLWACGENGEGQLGDGTIDNHSTPIQIMSDVSAISGGYRHSLILKADGTLFANGGNSQGQIGDGTTIDRHTPVQIATSVSKIFAGSSFSFIIKTDNTLWGSGSNGNGELGDGTTIDRDTLSYIMPGVLNADGGAGHALIVKTNNTLWTCGWNSHGQLGDGTTSDCTIPAQIMTDVSSASVGCSFSMYSLILKTDKTVWACGDNGSGQLGDGTIDDRHTFVKISSDVASMEADDSHNLMIKTDGSLWAWGFNGYGQLGDGTTQNRLSPVQIRW